MFWIKKRVPGSLKLSLVQDDGTLVWETDPIENLEYARFDFKEDVGPPDILDDKGDEWIAISPENWLYAFPVADRMLVTMPSTEYELEYTEARAFGLHVFILGNSIKV